MIATLLLAGVLWQTQQSQDVYQRVRQALGDDAVTQLRDKRFSALEERLSAVKAASGRERAETLALLGAIEFMDGKMAQAASDFQKAETLGAGREEDRFTHAMALVRLGEHEEEARTLLSELTKERASRALYWYWLGRVDYYQRRYSEAVENLQQAVQLDPKAARGWDSLGLAWDMQGHLEQAREMFEKAVALNRAQVTPSPWPPHNLGYLLLRTGETARAEGALRESLKYDGRLAQTHYYLGRTLEKEDRAAEAIEEYKVAVAGDATSADACYSLAMLYRKLKRENEAQVMFEEFKKRKNTVGANTGEPR